MKLLHFLLPALAAAESGIDAWLRYAPVSCGDACKELRPSRVVALSDDKQNPVYTAGQELQQGIEGMLDGDISSVISKPSSSNDKDVIVGTVDSFQKNYGGSLSIPSLKDDGYFININETSTIIVGKNSRGALYGAFRYLSIVARGMLSETTFHSNPDVPLRWVNQWDNFDPATVPVAGDHGPIERGYSGESIFFDRGKIREDLTRAEKYARLLASIGVNAVVINNVNADPRIFRDENLEGVAKIADLFRPYGVQLGLTAYFAAPEFFGLKTADPLDKDVIKWWDDLTEKIYDKIPDMAGYLIKADSEGQPGPKKYGRTLVQGANLFAKALKPYKGLVLFRAFIYDADELDLPNNWRDDRAVQAVENFEDMDGNVDDNVVIQIKNGPIDFQVREPVSSLFSHLKKTPMSVEIQVTQEYLGQQCHLAYLAPMYKQIFDFDFRIDGKTTPTKDLLNGKVHGKAGGYAAVVNVGMNETWLGSHLAMSNLYAFGRLAWEPKRGSEELIRDWTKMTFGHDKRVVDTMAKMSMDSWKAYEGYTGNLGMLTVVDAPSHFGPDPANRVHGSMATRAYPKSIGIDRTVKNGSGYAGQYPDEVAAMYESVDSTPDELLLFFHHVPYKHKLKSGKTVIQHIYDAHYSGVEKVFEFVEMWKGLKDKVDKQRYEEVLFRLVYQSGHAIVWRDAMVHYFRRLTDITDEKRRIKHKWRVEAETMKLEGYEVKNLSPRERASEGKAISTKSKDAKGKASWTSNFASSYYDIAVNYYDIAVGNSTWELFLNDRSVGKWAGDAEFKLGHSPSNDMNGVSAMRVTFPQIDVRKGDKLRIEGSPDGEERAPLDYVSFLPTGVID